MCEGGTARFNVARRAAVPVISTHERMGVIRHKAGEAFSRTKGKTRADRPSFLVKRRADLMQEHPSGIAWPSFGSNTHAKLLRLSIILQNWAA